ncbi:MAG: GGDEF domain-containing protein [Thermodesulfovibrio sp.]|nr:GGDEF domain-containing protein [Thermodesulfovibrio sp.]
MNRKIIALAKSSNTKKLFYELLDELNFEKYIFDDIKDALEIIYNEIPDMLIIDATEEFDKDLYIFNELKQDPLFVSMSFIAIVPSDFYCKNWKKFLFDDYVRENLIEKDFTMRVLLCFERAERIIATNPLTKLPGNLVIQREIQRRIDKEEIFSLAYADLDNFKPFNDKYGFYRGDEVIKMLGRVILNIVRAEQPKGSFVGHIGGDDFVYIMRPESIEETTVKIIEVFDNLIINFYDLEDIKKGYIESVSREGKILHFPIMTLSVGITSTKNRKFRHFSEMAEVASTMKTFAKKQKEKRYAIDRRRDF